MRVVDLSAPIADSPPGTPDFQRTRVEYLDNRAGAAEIEQLFGVPSRLLRDGEGWSREELTVGTHNATHLDAPYHYNSTIQGRPAQTIDELPLEWFYGPGVVVDFRAKEDGDAIDGRRDGRPLWRAAGHKLGQRDIVLVAPAATSSTASPTTSRAGRGSRRRPPTGCSSAG